MSFAHLIHKVTKLSFRPASIRHPSTRNRHQWRAGIPSGCKAVPRRHQGGIKAGVNHFRERTKKAERESREQSRPRPGAARRPNGRRPHAAGDGTAGRRERTHQGKKEPPSEKGTATPPAGHTSTQGQRPTRQAAASVHFPRPRRGRGTKGEGA